MREIRDVNLRDDIIDILNATSVVSTDTARDASETSIRSSTDVLISSALSTDILGLSTELVDRSIAISLACSTVLIDAALTCSTAIVLAISTHVG